MTTTTQPARWQAQHAATPAARVRWHLPLWIAFGTLVAVGLFWLRDGGLGALSGGPGAWVTSIGRFTGLVAADLLLIQVVMLARVPWIERQYGQDLLARWHRLVGFTSFLLLVSHIAATTLGYAAIERSPLLREAWNLVTTYPGMLLATVGTAALVMVTVTSVKIARARLRYESWHLLHLYAYLGIGLSLPHEFWTGADFAQPAAQVFWWTLYAIAAGSILAYRVGVPLWRSARHGVRVEAVAHEIPGITSVYLRGRHLDRLGARAGQFFLWRFRDRRGWTRANPFSLSAAPRPDLLRITVKDVGDGSGAVAGLRPGTRVLFEGPYGRFTGDVRRCARITLIACGIGITAIRALLEAEPYRPGDATLIYRARQPEDFAFLREIDAIAAARGVNVIFLPGSRGPDGTWLPDGYPGPLASLNRMVPQLTRSDVFVCGPERWMESVVATLYEAEVPDDQIHVERFGW
ncbi:MAG TPA: ferredoxin reductase family protein [Micromonosporaceae bacterium]|nr:ferredoxin reductase family protein [Micromonosporaceae bacterium]